MQKPELPTDEVIRQGDVERLRLTTEPVEASFEQITRLLQTITEVPITAFSVLDNERQFFKSIQGLDVRETGRDISFCGHVILQDDIMVVENALEDDRFADNPLVTGDPGIRFYAGIPVRSPMGRKVGTICAIDRRARALSDQERAAMEDLRGVLEAELVMRSASITDPLTGLFNRRYFEQIVNYEWRRSLRECLPVALVLYDMDHFHSFNDAHGHAAGDAVLGQVAEALEQQSREQRHLLGRHGGEEFVAVMPLTHRVEAEGLANRARQAIAALAIPHPGSELGVVTVSAGIAIAETQQELRKGYEGLIQQAKRALREAKQAGRNRALAPVKVLIDHPVPDARTAAP